jgi:hypothetical protein
LTVASAHERRNTRYCASHIVGRARTSRDRRLRAHSTSRPTVARITVPCDAFRADAARVRGRTRRERSRR